MEKIIIRGARVNNLKNISLEIPKNKLVVITGLSGSGKSSLAFDTIYAEGQRRYAESLSSYARQFMEMQDKPDVDEVTGLSPTIAIDQYAISQNPRSTVGTVTEIYDYLRLLFARLGKIVCPDCHEEASKNTAGQMVETIRDLVRHGETVKILAPIVRNERKPLREIRKMVESREMEKVRFDGKHYTADEFLALPHHEEVIHNLEMIVGEVDNENVDLVTKFVDTALEFGNGVLIIVWNKKELLFSTHWRCAKCGRRFEDLEPHNFSFNSPYGACPKCTGLGVVLKIDSALVIPNPRLTLAEGAIQPWMRITGNQNWYLKLLQAVAEAQGFSMNVAVQSLPAKVMDLLLNGTGEKIYAVDGKAVKFEGVIANLEEKHRETKSDYVRQEIVEYMREQVCPLCVGKRLRQETLAVRIFDKNISEMSSLSVEEAKEFFVGLGKELAVVNKKTDVRPKYTSIDIQVGTPVIREVMKRLNDLDKVGLAYISLDRPVNTLSGGEGQRVKLSTQLSSGLSGIIYILDEPSIGLHPRDLEKLIITLESLRELGNTVIVVEHDETIMRRADYVIDVGPGAGILGGEIVAAGTFNDILKNKNSLTGAYLSGRKQIELPEELHKGNNKRLTIQKATAFNLKNVDVDIPLGKLVCVTGVSGSGKSSLIIDILSRSLATHFYRAKDLPAKHKAIKGLENIDKVITIDQSPIGRTPRSNPATYTGVFSLIRDLFTEIPEAKIRGYDAGKFSFNVKGGGRCEACAGEGYVKIPMQFLADVYVKCEECQGRRYNAEALEIHFQTKNISDVLAMNVEEALKFFRQIASIADKLQILSDVGLGYLQLGQPATKLSGGEAQRVKLATELSRRATGRTIYILDEPTTGLHFEDIKQLLGVLNKLVDKGNTVLIIEHNLEVIKCADWVIDLGPDGGKKGGEVVAEGTPKEVAKIKGSYTGQYLKKIL